MAYKTFERKHLNLRNVVTAPVMLAILLRCFMTESTQLYCNNEIITFYGSIQTTINLNFRMASVNYFAVGLILQPA
jgi:hypothetical protein